MKILERICYNYQSHEYLPLDAWEAINCIGQTKQPKGAPEAEHYEKFKTIVEVCKVSRKKCDAMQCRGYGYEKDVRLRGY